MANCANHATNRANRASNCALSWPICIYLQIYRQKMTKIVPFTHIVWLIVPLIELIEHFTNVKKWTTSVIDNRLSMIDNRQSPDRD